MEVWDSCHEEETDNCWPVYCEGGGDPDPCEGLTSEECACQVYGTGCGGGGGDDEDEGFDEAAEAALKDQVFSTSSEAAETNVSYSSPDEASVPFDWVVVKNTLNLWKVTSYDVAKGYNSTNTGAIIYDIQHSGSSISGQTSWYRIPKRPIGVAWKLISLSWEETSNSKSIASDYKSGTITVSGNLKNFGVSFKNPTNSCTVTVQ